MALLGIGIERLLRRAKATSTQLRRSGLRYDRDGGKILEEMLRGYNQTKKNEID